MTTVVTVLDPERGQWTSASAAEADLLCPGRFKACMAIPEPEPSPDAASGTRIHSWLAGERVALTLEEQEIADACREAEKLFVNEWVNGEPFDTYTETRLWHTFDNGMKHSGKPDLVVVNHDSTRAAVIDYKTGRADVADNPRNLQLRDLAVLVAMAHSVGEVTVKIIQPTASDQPPCVYDMHDLVKALDEMESRLIAVHSDNPPRVAGERQCKYCRAKATCPEFLASSLPAEIPRPATQQPVQEAIALLPGARLGALLSMVRMVAEVADAETRRRLSLGDVVEGWTLAPGRTTEKVTDPNEVHTRFIALGGTTQQFMPAVTLAKGKLKNSLKVVIGEKGKGLELALDRLLAGCVESKTSEPVLTRE